MFNALAVTVALAAQQGDTGDAYAQLGPDARERLMACEVDAERFDALMALDPQSFDQDFSGGWRPVGDEPGCERAAADLLIAYMDHSPHFNREQPGVIGWHAGQMLAMSDEPEQAIAYFDAARFSTADWNLYVDATIAFLQRDRAAAEAARAELATMTPSEEEMASRRQFLAENPHITMPQGFVEQPQNLGVVDRLLTCWDRPYAEAYSSQCER
ncbi:MAG: hypothetical protein CMH91_06435 [Oceanicaulis sp.]|uniref:hypothetical protein n=1 Tax=unclassified Oceanicaulis TaxID=2632123 RepID=UPI000C6361F5|nr:MULTISPECIES: hypothetical protein [unclassified Oceanicaulis]MAB68112.1 hypothetical protein [Oceanicaulis sp.]MBC38687.1 hypothetical protein [Oceanicaulis sp.]MBG36356.1 hypothetical protein [Oceanicaulis sp.]HBU62398.1 hypothetical protein [Oceanicaulis sp.]HCR95313.1 hypothetical protein [Oceanicaulis sp.]